MKERYVLYGVINEKIARPAPELVKKFSAFSVADILKATNGKGLMNHWLKPIKPGIKICGPAATLFGRQGDTLMLQRVGDVIEPGDVVVADVGGVSRLSVIGERIAYYICNIRKANGIIIDGTARDKHGLKELDIPMFNRGKYDAKLYGAIGPGAINVMIQCGGEIVNPGDLIVGDDDGVVVIPQGELQAVLEKIEGEER